MSDKNPSLLKETGNSVITINENVIVNCSMIPEYVAKKMRKRNHRYIRFVVVNNELFYETSKYGSKFLRVK